MISTSEQLRSQLFTVKAGVITAAPYSNRNEFLFAIDSIVDQKYKVLEMLGHGGMGAVYKVHHLQLNKTMALKTFRSSEINSSSWLRFQREAQAIARLDHPNVVKVFDFGIAERAGGIPFYTMELLEGETLAERLKKTGRLNQAETIRLFIQISDGLAAVHSKGIVHGDIKPANIFLEAGLRAGEVRARLVDFGIASLMTDRPDDDQYVTSEIFGSPLYMSPEQFNGKKLTAASDIYSCGCALFETLTGALPLVGKSALATMNLHLNTPAPPLSSRLKSAVPPQRLEGLVSRMLAKYPQERPQSFTAVVDELKGIAQILAVRDQLDGTFTGEYTKPRSETLAANFTRSLQQSNSGEAEDTGEITSKPKEEMRKTVLLKLSLSLLLACGLGAAIYMQLKTTEIGQHFQFGNSKKSQTADGGDKDSSLSHPIAEVPANLPLPTEGDLDKYPKLKYQLDGQKLPSRNPAEKQLDIKENQFDKTINPLLPARTFIFPDNMTIGSLLYSKGNTFEVTDARGKVTTPAMPQFDPGEAVYKHPELLRGFAPSSIIMLRRSELCPITDEHMRYLSRLTDLSELYLGSSQISAASVQYFNKMPKLSILHLGKSSIDGNDLMELDTRKITSLDVGSIAHANNFLRKPGGFPNLTVLIASFDNLNDGDIEVISKFPELKQLHLFGNQSLTNSCLPSITKLKKLVRLEIQGTAIKPEAIPEICKLKALTDIIVDTGFWNDSDVARLKKAMGRPINVWLD